MAHQAYPPLTGLWASLTEPRSREFETLKRSLEEAVVCVPDDVDRPSLAVSLYATQEQREDMARAVLDLLIETKAMPREERCTGKFAMRLVETALEAAK